jgi:hypothetical protein
MGPPAVEEPVPGAEGVRTTDRLRDNPQLAASLCALPGLGQVYNRQPGKAAFFLLATLLTLGSSVTLIMAGERIGHALLERRQFAVFLLVSFGSIFIFLGLFCLGLAFWASSVVDARRTALDRKENREPQGGRWWLFRL